jgi:hypothetical protein
VTAYGTIVVTMWTYRFQVALLPLDSILLRSTKKERGIILTYSTVQSPSWEANWFAASQELPPISRNPKVHYRTHKRPPPVSILGQPNPVHIPTSHLLQIYSIIIHPSTSRSPQWSLSLWFPHQDPTYTPLLTHPLHMPSPSHSSRFYHPHNVGCGVQIIQFLVMQSPSVPRYLVPPRSKYSPQHHVLKHPQVPFLPQCQRPSFTHVKKGDNTGKRR